MIIDASPDMGKEGHQKIIHILESYGFKQQTMENTLRKAYVLTPSAIGIEIPISDKPSQDLSIWISFYQTQRIFVPYGHEDMFSMISMVLSQYGPTKVEDVKRPRTKIPNQVKLIECLFKEEIQKVIEGMFNIDIQRKNN